MAFLSSLRECVKKIESDVADVKHSYLCFESEETDKRSDFCLEMSRSIKKEITPLKPDTEKLKTRFKAQINHSKNYFYDMEDLTLDIQDEVKLTQNHLKDLVMNHVIQLESCEEEYPVELSCNESKISEHELSLTPELNLPSLTEKRIKETTKEISVEESEESMSDSSILEFKLEIPERKLIEIKTAKKSLPVYLEKSNKKIAVDKKTKSFNLFPSPMPSASKLGDVARRLDFEDD